MEWFGNHAPHTPDGCLHLFLTLQPFIKRTTPILLHVGGVIFARPVHAVNSIINLQAESCCRLKPTLPACSYAEPVLPFFAIYHMARYSQCNYPDGHVQPPSFSVPQMWLKSIHLGRTLKWSSNDSSTRSFNFTRLEFSWLTTQLVVCMNTP